MSFYGVSLVEMLLYTLAYIANSMQPLLSHGWINDGLD